MRNVYYQSVGNPLQLDRLPATRPETEMLPPRVALGTQFSQLAVSLLSIAGAVLVTFLLCWPPGLVWLEPYDLIFAGPAVAVGFGPYWTSGWVQTYTPGYMTSHVTMRIEVLGFDVKKDKPIWVSTSETKDPTSARTVIEDVVKGVRSDMKKQHLIP